MPAQMQYVTSTVFCPGFQKGRVASEKGTFSAMEKMAQLVQCTEEKGTISAMYGRKGALLMR